MFSTEGKYFSSYNRNKTQVTTNVVPDSNSKLKWRNSCGYKSLETKISVKELIMICRRNFIILRCCPINNLVCKLV